MNTGDLGKNNYRLNQGSQTQFPRELLEAVFGCGRAAIGIPRKLSESILKCPY